MRASEHRSDPVLLIDANRIQRDIDALSAFTSTPGEGVTRLAYSDQESAARDWVRAEMEAVGLCVAVDPAGNLIGRFSRTPVKAALAVGSHIDSVVNGGRFDGAAGTVAALECARAIAQLGPESVRPIEFICFAAEESARFGPLAGRIGSRAMAGVLPPQSLTVSKDSANVSIADAMRLQGLDPAQLPHAARPRGDLSAFIELHIEQGAALATSAAAVGSVTVIAGATRIEVTITGRADHSGGTPMLARKDALAAAAAVIVETERLAKREPGSLVATVGRISAYPNLVTVVPGRATFTIDIRDVERKTKARFVQQLEESIVAICAARDVELEMRRDRDDEPTPLSSHLVDHIMKSASALGLRGVKVVSHTGHDASSMSKIADAGMIFVRNPSGRSHCPDEHVDSVDLANAVRVLMLTLVNLAIRGPRQ